MKRTIRILAALVVTSVVGHAGTIYVPDDYGTIQAAIDNAVSGDAIVVRPGIYVETIDFIGKNITVRSEQGPGVTTVDGGQGGSVVSIVSGEGPGAVLEGFTITNGSGTPLFGSQRGGGGIFVRNGSSPTLRGNVITGNTAHFGGGVYAQAAASLIEGNTLLDNTATKEGAAALFDLCAGLVFQHNVVTDNTATLWGAGLEIVGLSDVTVDGNVIANNTAVQNGSGGILLARDVTATITNNFIHGNTVTSYGAGIDVFSDCYATIANNSIHGNTGGSGGGVACREGSHVVITNTILWGNVAATGPEIFLDMQQTGRVAEADVSFSDVAGGATSVHIDATCILNWGDGMIEQPPGFVDSGNGDLHLSRQSPCVNRGTNAVTSATDPDGDPRPTMGTADMGADEYVGTHSLASNGFALSAAAGGTVALALDAEVAHAGRLYTLAGSLGGTGPGTSLPGGLATVPLNLDAFTIQVLQELNSPAFSGFLGTLGGAGTATASLIVGVPLDASLVGLEMHFAFVLPWDFVSNPVVVEIVI